MNRKSTKQAKQAKQAKSTRMSADDPGELIGRRVGQGTAALSNVLAQRGADNDAEGGRATARRNAKARAPRATAALEDSRTKPSRKSTRRSANRIKSGTAKTQTVKLAVTSPSARTQRR